MIASAAPATQLHAASSVRCPSSCAACCLIVPVAVCRDTAGLAMVSWTRRAVRGSQAAESAAVCRSAARRLAAGFTSACRRFTVTLSHALAQNWLACCTCSSIRGYLVI
jgi:hypothetical protein